MDTLLKTLRWAKTGVGTLAALGVSWLLPWLLVAVLMATLVVYLVAFVWVVCAPSAPGRPSTGDERAARWALLFRGIQPPPADGTAEKREVPGS